MKVLALITAVISSGFIGSNDVRSVYASVNANILGAFQGEQDIGARSKAGSTIFDGVSKSYRVTGGGENISAQHDSFHFVYAKSSGDITFSADVRFEGTDGSIHNQIMLMARQSPEPDAAYADLTLFSNGVTSLQYRPSVGVAASEFRAPIRAPSHLILTRRGHEFAVYAGNPGEQPIMTGPIVVVMQDPIYLGLGVSSHNRDLSATAVFSNVRLTKGAKQY